MDLVYAESLKFDLETMQRAKDQNSALDEIWAMISIFDKALNVGDIEQASRFYQRILTRVYGISTDEFDESDFQRIYKLIARGSRDLGIAFLHGYASATKQEAFAGHVLQISSVTGFVKHILQPSSSPLDILLVQRANTSKAVLS
jgi:hypothetical protein